MKHIFLLVLLFLLTDLCFGQKVDTSAHLKAGLREHSLAPIKTSAPIKIDSLHSAKRSGKLAALPADSLSKDSVYKNSLPKDSLSIVKDSASVKDSAKVLAPIYIPFNQFSIGALYDLDHMVVRDQIRFNDYRTSGDMLEQSQFTFIRDLGTLGQPHEVNLFGAGFNELSVMKDGLLINDRLTNTFDFNSFQTESVDSVEILPLPRGFLYGSFNNQVAVNFISKETIAIKKKAATYSKLSYYQAQNGEAMVDFIYDSQWFRRLSTQFEITNKTYNDNPPQPKNSDYSLWNLALKFKYLLSRNFNLIASYNYIKSNVGLYGGITEKQIDTLRSLSDLDLRNADVYFTNRYKKNTSHNFVLQLIGNTVDVDKTDLKAYYFSDLQEFRQNETDSLTSHYRIFDNNRSKVYGLSLREFIDLRPFIFNFNTDYEVNDFKTDLYLINRKINSFSISGNMSLRLSDSSLVPSVFGKYLNYDGKSFPGVGADIKYNYSKGLILYAGLSQFRQPFSLFEEQFISSDKLFNKSSEDYRKIGIFEAGLEINYKCLRNSFSVFHRNVQNDPLAILSGNDTVRTFRSEVVRYLDMKYWGIGSSFKFNLWRIYFEGYGVYYYNEKAQIGKYRLPEYTLRGGIYYRDTLFNANLHLKTGFYARYTGVEDYYSYDFETQMRAISSRDLNTSDNTLRTVSPSLQLDFKIIAEIQQRAILYFTLENLLDKMIYTVP
ncbi:MAG: hypothetical protein ACM3MI_15995, partial [Clostridiales bacterium]